MTTIFLTGGLAVVGEPEPIHIQVQNQVVGSIPHIHGTVNGPLLEKWWRPAEEACGNYPNWWSADFTERFKQVGIPAVRPHGAGSLDFNKIWKHWPDYSFDVHEKANYDFEIADMFVHSTIGVTDIVARFGFSKGNLNEPSCAWAVPPPKEEFASICANIVRHFNEGWAWNEKQWGPWHEGWKIDHWIVWNEPYYSINAEAWWTGTPTEYAELYEAIVTAVKNVDKSVQLGPCLNISDFGDEFFERWSAFENPPPIDFVDVHLYGESPLMFPWRVHEAPKTKDGNWNWEDYLESAGIPRETPLIIGEWNRKIPNYATDAPGAAFVMCSLSLLADLAEETGLHNVKMAHLFSVGKIWQGSTNAPQNPVAGGGAAIHFYGEHLALASPNRLFVTSPEPDPTGKDKSIMTAIAGRSNTGQRITVVLSQYEPKIANQFGEAFTTSLEVEGLHGGNFQYARVNTENPLNFAKGFAEGNTFGQEFEMVENSIETLFIRYCPQDVNDSGETDMTDLLTLIDQWRETEPLIEGDVNLDGTVGTLDLIEVIKGWGACDLVNLE